jgi:glycyl-tRNA synthetase (class II)
MARVWPEEARFRADRDASFHDVQQCSVCLKVDCAAPQSHPKFASVSSIAPLLFSRTLQKSEEKQPKPMSLADAVVQKIIANETLAYFIGRTYLFMVRRLPESDYLRAWCSIRISY